MEALFKKRKERIGLFKKTRKAPIVPKDKKEIPNNMFKQCTVCESSIVYEDLKKELFVCPQCGNHMGISSRERIRQTVDENTFRSIDSGMRCKNPEEFDGYKEKLCHYQNKTGLNDAVICGVGKIGGHRVAIAAMDSHFMMGSMGSVVGEKITRCIELATKKKIPLIVFCTSGGARMQEGIISLMQMAKTSSAIAKLDEAKGLYISVLTNPTTGGVSASFAMLGDIILAEPKALIGFAGKRVIEKTIHETLPKEFQKAEFMLEKGFVDQIVGRKELRGTLLKLIQLHERRVVSE